MPPENPAPPTVPPPTVVSTPPPVNVEHKERSDDLLEPGEQVVTIVRRHPIGIVAIYVETLLGVIALIALIMFLAPNFRDNLTGQSYSLFLMAIVLAVALVSLILFVATLVYRQCRLIVSDKSVIQIIQRGLFIRKISRLSMSNVQDVSADHNGILATMLGYGTLTVETAGEEDNFIFPLCPRPDSYAEQILEARQKYVQSLDETHRGSVDV